MSVRARLAFESYLEYSDNIDYCQFFVEMHPTESNKLTVLFEGEKGSIHEGGLYRAEFTFIDNEKSSVPISEFLKPLPYHCNIGEEGQICLDYLKEWNQNSNFNSLLEAISYLIHNQNPFSCLRLYIGQEQNDNTLQYIENVKNQAQFCKQTFSQY